MSQMELEFNLKGQLIYPILNFDVRYTLRYHLWAELNETRQIDSLRLLAPKRF